MEDSFEWKEAKVGKPSESDLETERYNETTWMDDRSSHSDRDQYASDQADEVQEAEEDAITCDNLESCPDEVQPQSKAQSSRSIRTFSHKSINLSLRRNITALSDPNQHKPKQIYDQYSKDEPFDLWLANALVAISPNADMLLFVGQSPEKIVFYAKLRMEPINQYTTKSLDIPLDHDEHITSLLCLPIMSSQKTSHCSVDWTVLVIGLSSGYVKFYTEQSICLISLKLSVEPVLGLKCQTQKSNLNGRSETHFATLNDELLITYRTSAVCIDGLELYDNLRIAKAEVVNSRFNYEPAYTLDNIPSIFNYQRWRIECSDNAMLISGDLLGRRQVTAFDSLLSDSIDPNDVQSKLSAKTLALIGRDPFVAFLYEPKESTPNSYTEIITSIFSLWSKPKPSRTQEVDVSRPASVSLFDRDRLATTLIPSPDKRLAAITDDFGRVLLIDVTNKLVVRVWKGYRSAQCGWIEVKRNPEERGCPHATFLVIYAPKRGLLEIWSVQRGPRVAAFNVGKSCRLLYCGYRMLNMRAKSLAEGSNIISQIEQSYSSNCYLLNAKSETIFCVELPYSYSLYKYGDLKSRDRLLIAELSNAIQQDSEVEVISDVLHRVALNDSIQRCIHKIANGLSPDKISLIMENLINKTMKIYDNHSGAPMSCEDKSVINACKCLIRLCSIYRDLSIRKPERHLLPDVNQGLISKYHEHPKEIESFSEALGWSTTEILRYLSLLALERSFESKTQASPWPNLGEPLSWSDFVSCFELKQPKPSRRSTQETEGSKTIKESPTIRLKEMSLNFLRDDKVAKTAFSMYYNLSEDYHRASQDAETTYKRGQIENSYNDIDPPSRLALLVQFWLSTSLSSDWKMWSFLQNQLGRISDELKIIAMEQQDDLILIDTWKQIYNLILESDNIYAAIIATASIRSDTIRMLQDDEKRIKMEKSESKEAKGELVGGSESQTVDWECLCIDAERMSLLLEELEDVFLLNLLLRYSIRDGHLVDKFLYRVPRLSVASILCGGPTIVSELVAQWAVQSFVDLKVFSEPYGREAKDLTSVALNEEGANSLGTDVVISGSLDRKSQHHDRFFARRITDLNRLEQAKELIHHIKTSFPRSLEADTMMMYCAWELCRQWASQTPTVAREGCLSRVFDCFSQLSCQELRHKLAAAIYRSFFQRIIERLVVLMETNSMLISAKSSRLRDQLTRRELGLGQDQLDEFVGFCCDLSEFMLQTSFTKEQKPTDEELEKMNGKLLSLDPWWTTPKLVKMLKNRRRSSDQSHDYYGSSSDLTLVERILTGNVELSVQYLIELTDLTNLMRLVFKLKIPRAYPLTIIGDSSRQILQIDANQEIVSANISPADLKNRSSPLSELRLKFARRCIVSLVNKIGDGFSDGENSIEPMDDDQGGRDIDTELEDSDQHPDRKTRAGHDKQKSKQRRQDNKTATTSSKTTSINMATSSTNKAKQAATVMRDGSGVVGIKSSSIDADNEDANANPDDHYLDLFKRDAENNESMVLFSNLLSLSKEWAMDCDELHLELVFELYRCNLDKLADQMSARVADQRTLASGLLKIASQRVLVLYGLSPHFSGPKWRQQKEVWSRLQPSISNWLKSIQMEEVKREIGPLSFPDSLRVADDDQQEQQHESSLARPSFGLKSFVIRALKSRTRLVLERATNHLEGQAARLAYDLLELLESQNYLDRK